MKRIKDFIYNHNDLLVTLIILAVAALVISSRMNAILDYPAEVAALSAEASKEASGEIVIPGSNDEQDPAEQGGEQIADGQQGTEGGGQTGEGQNPQGGEQTADGQQGTQGGEQTSGGEQGTQGGQEQTTPTEPKTIQFTVKGQKGWQQLAQDLKEAGVINDWHAFYYRALERYNEKPIYFYDRTYTFQTGLSDDEVIDILNTK